jgi:Flp pilus assembly protein TadG
MVFHNHERRRSRRAGVAVLELAILLPLIVFLFVVAVDYSRIFYFSLTLTNCARNGAIYGSDPTAAAILSPYTSIEQAALADATNLTPQPAMSSKTDTDDNGNTYIEVTATYQFQSLTQYPGIPNTVDLSQTVRMRISPATPSFN